MAHVTEPAEEQEPEGGVPLTLNDAIEDLETLCEEQGWDYGVKVEVAAECAWSAEVRVTQKPNQDLSPDRSLVTFRVHGEPEDALASAVEDMLAWLGERREHDKIRAAEQEFFDRLWYYRTLARADRTAQELAEAEDRLREIEAKYDNVKVENPFELGVIHGKLSALRWVLGDDWDTLDT